MTPASKALVISARSLPDGARLVLLTGVVDRHTARRLEQRLVEEARKCTRTPPRLMLDLGQVTFLDRDGLDTLLDVQTRMSNGFGSVELANPNPRVVRLLHEAHLDGTSGTPPAGKPESADHGPHPD